MSLKNYCLLVLLATSTTIVQAQAWTWQNPLPNGNPLVSVWWTNLQTAWAVGNYGNVEQTTDGGTTWVPKNVSSGSNFSKVIFPSASNGWIFGASITMHTTDNGITWNAVNTGPAANATINDASFSGTQNLWLVGNNGLIVNTGDGGNTWAKQTSTTTQNLTSVGFINATTGFACGANATILKTLDGGATWAKLTTSPAITQTITLRSIAAIDANNAVVVADGGKIYVTRDRGATWQADVSVTTQNLSGVAFYNYNNGIAVGAAGTILITADGGSTWSKSVSPITDQLYGVRFFDSQHWIAVGNASRILVTTNDGAVWTQSTQGTTIEFLSIDFGDTLNGCAVGRNGQIWRTTNGGTTWINASIQYVYHNINAVSFVNKNLGWAVGDTAYIIHTSNGGATWVTENLPIITKMNLYNIKFVDANNGWLCGANGTYLFRTVNGGATWTTAYTQITGTATLRGLAVIGTNVCAVGNNGVIYHTFDGGATWKKQTSNTSQTLNSVSMFDNVHALACGAAGTLVETTDAGTTWNPVITGTSQNLNCAVFESDSSARICGTGGAIMRSTDFGATWLFAQPQPTSNNFNWIVAPTTRSAFTCGQYGSILKSYQPRAALSTSVRTLNFDSLQVNSCDSATLNAVNVGDTAVSIYTVSLGGEDTSEYSLAPFAALPITLQPGKSTPFTVHFCPNDTGSSIMQLTLLNTSPSPILTVLLNGYAGYLNFSAGDTLDFKKVAVNNEFDTSEFIVNTGILPLKLKSLSIVGPDSAMFIFNGTFNPTTIESKDSLEVRFILVPTAAGPVSATAVFETNGSVPIKIYLHANDATGVSERGAKIILPDDALAVAPQPMQDHATISLQLNNEHSATLILSDMLGRVVWEQHVAQASENIAMQMPSTLQAGTYFLSLNTMHGTATRPVVVIR